MKEKTKKVKVEQVVSYYGHTLRSNGNVDLTLKAGYSELVNAIQLIQMLNNDVVIKAKLPDKKPMSLGMFRVKDLKISDDGETTIKFNSLNVYVEMDNLNMLTLDNEEVKQFKVLYETEVELEEE